MKRTTFAAACVLCPALLLAACAPQGAASASAFGDRPPMDESISASSADALPAEDGSILLAEGAVTLMLSADRVISLMVPVMTAVLAICASCACTPARACRACSPAWKAAMPVMTPSPPAT